MLMTEPPPALMIFRDPHTAAKERAEQVEPYDPPEFLDWRCHHRVVLRRRSSGVVVQDVQCTKLTHGSAYRRLHARLVRHVGADDDGAVSCQMRRLLAGNRIDFRDRHVRAFTCEQDRGRAPDPGPGPGDERYLSRQPCHPFLRFVTPAFTRCHCERSEAIPR
jgi:hypothetical protein